MMPISTSKETIMTETPVLSDITRTVDGVEERLVRFAAPTTEAGWLMLLENLTGDSSEARAAYYNMMLAVAADEDGDIVLSHTDDFLDAA